MISYHFMQMTIEYNRSCIWCNAADIPNTLFRFIFRNIIGQCTCVSRVKRSISIRITRVRLFIWIGCLLSLYYTTYHKDVIQILVGDLNHNLKIKRRLKRKKNYCRLKYFHLDSLLHNGKYVVWIAIFRWTINYF